MNEIELNKLLDETRKKIGSRKMSDTELDNLLDEVMGIKEYNHIKERIDIKTLKPCNIISMLNSIEDPFFNSIILQFNIDVKNVDTHAITQDFYKALEYKNSISITTCLHNDTYTKKNDVTFSIIATWDKITDAEEQNIIDDILQAFAPYEPYKEEKPIKKQDVNKVHDYIVDLAKFTNPQIYATKKQGFTAEELLLQGETVSFIMGKNKERTIEITIENEELNELFSFMTGTDKLITNAINSEIEAGNNDLHVSQIAKIAFGCTGTPSDKQKTIIYKTIEKMAGIRLGINVSKLVNGETIVLNGKEQNAKIHTNAYSTIGITLKTANRKTLTEGCYHFYEPPVYSQIAKQQKQFTTIPLSLKFTVFKKLSSTIETSNLFDYLIERIALMSPNKKNENFYKIKYETIICDVLKRQRKELPANKKTHEKLKTRMKKNTNTILEVLKKEEYIQDFEEYKNGMRYAQGVKITL